MRPACSAFGFRARVPSKRGRSPRGGTTGSGGDVRGDAALTKREEVRIRLPRLLLGGELAERQPDHLLGGGGRFRDSFESAFGFALAVAEVPNALKGLRARIGSI